MVPSREIGFLLPLAVSCTSLLAGCDMVVLRPSGYVASQQGQLVVISTLLMLLIIIPVIVLTLVFAWHYRASNPAAKYTPDWDHSIQLELVIACRVISFPGEELWQPPLRARGRGFGGERREVG